MKNKIIKTIYHHNKNLIVLLTFIIALLALGIPQLELDYSQKSWFREGDKLVQDYESFKKEYGGDAHLIITLGFKENAFTPKNMQKIVDINDQLWEVPNILSIESIINYTHIHGKNDDIFFDDFIEEDKIKDPEYLAQKAVAVKQIKEVRNYLISDNLKTIPIYAKMRIIKGKESIVSKLAIKTIKEKIASKYPDIEIQFTGRASVGEAFQTATMQDIKLILPIAFLTLTLVLMLYLRNFLVVTISMGIIALTLIATLGLQGWLGIKIGLITAMCPLIVLAICIVDLIHIFSSYLQCKKGNPLVVTLKKNITPTFLTSATTILGFLSFSTSDLLPIAHMGVLASFGIAVAWVLTIFLLCPILTMIPLQRKSTQKELVFMPSIFNLISRKPGMIVIVFSVAIFSAFFIGAKNQIDGNVQNYFSQKTPFSKATKNFNQTVGGTNNIEIVLQSEKGIKDPEFLTKVDQLIKQIEGMPSVTKVNSIIAPLKQIHQVLNGGQESQYKIADRVEEIAQELFFLEVSLPPERNIFKLMSMDRNDMRLSIFWRRSSSQEIFQGRDLIMKMVKDNGLKGHVTGIAPLISGLDKYIVNSFIESMLIATVSITIFMMIVFKSFFFGLLALIPNIIVPSFGAAVLYLSQRDFDAGSVLVFSICLGIAIDDTIYFITNFKREFHYKKRLRCSIESVLNQAGSTLCMTTATLVIIFSLFFFGSFIPNQNFAIATTTILSAALLLDLVFLPALILLINRSQFVQRKFSTI